MPIIGAFVFPHGAITLDPQTRDLTKEPAYLPTTKENCIKLHEAMKSQAELLVSLKPDLIILSTPHGLRLRENYVFLGNDKAAGSAEWDGKWQEFSVDIPMDGTGTAKSLVEFLSSSADPYPVELIILGDSTEDSLPLRWAEAIPYWFITEAAKSASLPVPSSVIVGIPTKRSNGDQAMIPELLKLGNDISTFIQNNLSDKKVAIVTSCDLSHYHSKDPTSPYEFNEDAVPFDNFCVAWSKVDLNEVTIAPGGSSNQQLINQAGGLADHIGSCGYTGLVLLQGILSKYIQDTKGIFFKPNFLEYSWPTYYGMLVGHFIPKRL